MKLGADGIFVELAGEAFELRPSLRASMHLVRRYGLPGLLAAVQGFNVAIIMDMLRETAIKPSLLLAEIAAFGLGSVRNRLTGPLAEFVLAIAGIDPDEPAEPTKPSTSEPVAPERAFAQLFGMATGSLGWHPEIAWTATPAEIVAALNGQTAHLIRTGVLIEEKAGRSGEHYTPEQLAKIKGAGHDPAFNRSGLHGLKGKERVT